MLNTSKTIISTFKIYENKSHRNFERTGEYYELLAPNDRFLPFIYKRSQSANGIKEIRVVDKAGATVYTALEPATGIKVYISDTLNQDWVIYYGQLIAGMVLACDIYSLEIEDLGGNVQYSEHFVPQSDLTEFVKLEYWSDSNIENTVYDNGFRNTLYFDTKISDPKPTSSKKVSKDGFDNENINFVVAQLEYNIGVGLIPEYLVNALNKLILHENVVITDNERIYETPNEFTLNGGWKVRRKWFDATINFNDFQRIRTGCAQENDLRLIGTPPPSDLPPVANNVYIIGSAISLNPNPWIPPDLSGNPSVGSISEVTFNFFDPQGHGEGAHLYKWQIETTGGNYVDIAGATEKIYTPINANAGKFLRCIVTPVADTGTVGLPAFSNSAYVGGGLSEHTVTIAQGAGTVTGNVMPIVLSVSPTATKYGHAVVIIEDGAGNSYSIAQTIPIGVGASIVNANLIIVPNLSATFPKDLTIKISSVGGEPTALFLIGSPSEFIFSYDPAIHG